ncbi:S8 family peptidase [Tumebacillus permanentifrigoris]|uniref:Subtilisin family serine protease n=1 Tax=Tumebacillus permanentifrigoris TaxID=378543 RepID=A0A316D9G8_9BACL|nr:S8 family peptidase [Tumebacillus permanentifrigoris]PWK13400.1 subtilisin family serine protease [Tumebacillus permanentifrigoris]
MKKVVSRVLLGALTLSLLAPQSITSASEVKQKSVSMGNYLVQFKDVENGKVGLAKRNKKIAKAFTHNSFVAVQDLSIEDLEALQADDNVAFVEPDFKIQSTEEQVPLNLEQVQAPKASAAGWTGTGVKVAILDTGIDTESAELKIAGGASFVAGEVTTDDLNGHGTHVAGILAAQHDDQGLVGVAPNVELYAVKVMNGQGAGTYSQLISGLEWAADNHMDIVSMSLAGREDSLALKEAVDIAAKSGVLLVSAAGNDGESDISYPAKYASVIAVGAVDANNQHAVFSNTGVKLELVAPGVGIESLSLADGYVSKSGTSMAVPHVAGVAALVKQQNPTYTAQQVRDRLDMTATALGDSLQFGKGLVNAEAATSGTAPTSDGLIKEPTTGTEDGDNADYKGGKKANEKHISSAHVNRRQTIMPSESASVALKLTKPVQGVEITVASINNSKKVLDTVELTAQKAGDVVPYTWRTSADTKEGTYLIRMHYLNEKNVADDLFSVTVEKTGDKSTQQFERVNVAFVDPTSEPNDTPSQAQTIDLGAFYMTALTRNPLEYADMYKFTVPYDMNAFFYFSNWGGRSNFVRIYSIENGVKKGIYTQNFSEIGQDIPLKANTVYYLDVEPDFEGCLICDSTDSEYEFQISPSDPQQYNDSIYYATQIALDSLQQADVSSSTDSDYYSFTSNTTGQVNVNVTAGTTLQVFGSDGQTELTNNASVNPNSVGNNVYLPVSANTNYFILVKGPVMNYSLTLGKVNPDTFELNDTFDSARNITVNTFVQSFVSTPKDVDTYSFTFTTPGDKVIVLNVPDGQDYGVELLSSNRTSITKLSSGASNEVHIIGKSLLANTTYYVRVSSNNDKNSVLPYTLQVNDYADTFEPNDDISRAVVIQPSTFYQSQLSSATDSDIYSFTATKTGKYHLSIRTPQANTFSVIVASSAGVNVASTTQALKGYQHEFEMNCVAGVVYGFQIKDVNGYTTAVPYAFEVTESSGLYTYDGANRLLTYTVHRGLNNYRIDYTYDPNGNLLKKIRTNL